MNKKETILSFDYKNGKLCLQADHGKKWHFPRDFDCDVAIASLVYSTLICKKNEISYWSNKFKITMAIEILD